MTLVLATCLTIGGVLSPAAAAQVPPPPALKHACSPAPTGCEGWYRTPVTLRWDYDTTAAHVSEGNCSERTFTADTPGTVVYCEVADNVTGATFGYPVTIRVDRTPPTVSASPQRPPDYGGWFNHPVSVNFVGQDATSGIAFCTSGTYAGPDGAGVVVGGSCTDVTGNVTSAAFTLNYDATPPPKPSLDALPGNHRIALDWSTSPDSQAEVVRLAKNAAPVVVYRGPASGFTDRGLKNRRRYRYTVTLIDQAGNRVASTTSTVPTASKLLVPPKGSRVLAEFPPTLIWKPVKKASYYNVQVFRRGTKVLSSWPRDWRYRLKRSWRFGGKRYRFVPGKYCWYVWPGYGKRSKRDYGKRLGRSCFRVIR